MTTDFITIKEDNSLLLQARVLSEVLELRLTVSEHDKPVSIFVGQIKNFQEIAELNSNF